MRPKLQKKFTKFRPQIRSRHPSHSVLRVKGYLPFMTFPCVIRFGSSTELPDTKNKGGRRIEINTVEAIKTSSNKRLMKEAFKRGNVRTALWYTLKGGRLYDEINERYIELENLDYPIIAKSNYGSRGRGNTKLDSIEELRGYLNTKGNLNNYIFEKFYNFAREYRLHVTEDGCFYTCRKMMKKDTPEDDKWFKNDQNCIWAMESNPNFDKPFNWEEVERESIKALKAVGLDFGAIDLRIQSNKQSDNPSFIVVEINSAPSFGEVTAEKYKQMLPKLILKKANK